MPITADLHLHSTASDGTLSPAEVMRRVAEFGLQGASLTDHDTADGIAEAREEAARLGIDFISGIELSSGDGTREIHVLGYGLDPGHAALEEHREATYAIRRSRIISMVERLQSLGHRLELDAALAHVGDGMPGRPHVARAMVEAGIVDDLGEAFRTYLAEGGEAFIPKPVFHVRDAIQLIHRTGGVAVLAHPGHQFTDHEIAALVRLGLDGIEVSHPSHTADLEAYYRVVAERLGLIATGGSDYHGARDGGDGRALGSYGVGIETLHHLRERARTYSRPQSDPCPAS